MKTELILTGIQQATCKAELSAHIDLVQEAVQSGECNYTCSEWLRIVQEAEDKTYEFDERVFH